LVLCFFAACHAQQVTEVDFYNMLAGMYKQTVPLAKADTLAANYLILDTRALEEYEVSHLPDAIWVGYDHFQQQKVDALDKEQPILVYCSVGYRSERIGERLQKMGFSNVHNLYGGIFDWVYQGKDVIDAQGDITQRVHTYNKKWSKWLFVGEKVW